MTPPNASDPPTSREVDPARVDLLSLTPMEAEQRLGDHFRSRGEPAFRVKQVLDWLYRRPVDSLGGMTNLSLSAREALEGEFSLEEPAVERLSRSVDGTTKHLWRLADGELVESVLIPAGDRLTLCLSSQAGCAMGCTFCATGWAGFGRQLSAGEITAQYRASLRWAEAEGLGPITNLVYMGMGEPLANRKAVLPSLTILNQGYGLGARRITVSTVGVVPGILALARRPEQFGLAVSLHAPVTELRKELIPLEERYPLPQLMEALRTFNRAGGRRITFEYTMIQGVNDSPTLVAPLAALAREVQAFVNLIPFNPIPYREWNPTPPEGIRRFREGLEGSGVAVAVREPRGRDIDAACGQLRANALVELAAPGRGRGRSTPAEGQPPA